MAKCRLVKSAEVLLAVFGALFMLAELALILRVPLPSILPWSVVSVVGAGTVLSYAIVADYFPIEIEARANGALNLLHFGWAFAVQYGIGNSSGAVHAEVMSNGGIQTALFNRE